MHLTSKYEGATTLDFAGDDDIWVFVNGRLVIDLGGIHAELADTVNLGALHVPFVGCEFRAADNHGAVKGLTFAGHDFSTGHEDLVITYYDPAGTTYAMPNILGEKTYGTQTITFTTNIQTVGDAVTAINAQLTAVGCPDAVGCMVASDDGGLIKIVSTAAGVNSPATSNNDWKAIRNDRIAIDTGLTGLHAAGLFVELYPTLNVGDTFSIDVFLAERGGPESHWQIQTIMPVNMMECMTNMNDCDSVLKCNSCSIAYPTGRRLRARPLKTRSVVHAPRDHVLGYG